MKADRVPCGFAVVEIIFSVSEIPQLHIAYSISFLSPHININKVFSEPRANCLIIWKQEMCKGPTQDMEQLQYNLWHTHFMSKIISKKGVK